jgi:hypothetical protein
MTMTQRAPLALGVVAGRDQQRGGAVDADAVHAEEAGRGGGDEWPEQVVDGRQLLVEGEDAPAEDADGGLRGREHKVAIGSGAK